MIRSYRIDDDLAAADQGAVEVSITLADESRRWCFFTTPAALVACGDFVAGTTVRVHIGERHMIVVSEVTAAIIAAVLRELDESGQLERHTLPLQTR